MTLTQAEHVSGYAIKVRFSDGAERVIDFESFLKQSTNPHIRKYLAIEKFTGFQIRNGDLVWNDYDLCDTIRLRAQSGHLQYALAACLS